ncbi:hypothetical protein Gotri_011547 [Gossypium trilobum]|uniref:Uncharacterized protein n=1 Tax=Gossypium trilobum TaxID=34281 RepID=A0A7J9EV21_9ROSI|nr:hypothetical protein [Gossypium trilobum]
MKISLSFVLGVDAWDTGLRTFGGVIRFEFNGDFC